MSSVVPHKEFEERYLALRKKEGRLYSDEEVRNLPLGPHRHLLRKEWRIRKESCSRLIRYFAAQEAPLNILEIGCGNGWLCNRLSKIHELSVTGIDVNEMELKQAKRVFPSINFIYGDVTNMSLQNEFDAIVFAASFQYFRSTQEILRYCFSHLNKEGEVHILDTHFYSKSESASAADRSKEYFATHGFPQMHEFYFHHSRDELEGLIYEVLYDPKKRLNKLFYQNPFPWIRIKK